MKHIRQYSERTFLFNLHHLFDAQQDDSKVNLAYDNFIKALLPAIVKKWPVKEMDILKKYGRVSWDKHVQFKVVGCSKKDMKYIYDINEKPYHCSIILREEVRKPITKSDLEAHILTIHKGGAVYIAFINYKKERMAFTALCRESSAIVDKVHKKWLKNKGVK